MRPWPGHRTERNVLAPALPGRVPGASNSRVCTRSGLKAIRLATAQSHLRDVTVTLKRLALTASPTAPLTRWSPMTLTVTEATVGVDDTHDLGSGVYTAAGCPQGDNPWRASPQAQQVRFQGIPHFAS